MHTSELTPWQIHLLRNRLDQVLYAQARIEQLTRLQAEGQDDLDELLVKDQERLQKALKSLERSQALHHVAHLSLAEVVALCRRPSVTEYGY